MPTESKTSSALEEYRPFAETWYKIYELAKPEIDKADLEKYPYKVRVFDKILWIIGQEKYGKWVL